ncbi:Na-K-2Cl cotransporter 1 [Thecamonas trahens ATCC 50062]|uniref:Na-K-2Cl cotransporter 1 n=1 Tax=Thecamonas trahens ATCC 50062 TaxID=461836 RepID=A0A0L0DI59_THETB|nr:Na-K-2Cl cotransporter 1 [Thecamonas trahens ATCC 50062]KNC51786.1 Na-K-2Cl cotransporter 1 [Thecamonas trahens ATCC 50062]|eukprot:XP_013755659.1 Na-K-2Cl cotransporter 1 [Thecamonas trahens ATCC 50062]
MAGANISGDLKDAQLSIPRGTIAAVAVSGVVYLVLIWMLGATLVKEVPGTTPGGLLHNNEIMIQSAFFGPLIIAGIFAAGLSSALAALVGAPRVFQAVCEDGLFPALVAFAKGRGANNEPVRAYVLTFLIAGAVMCIGDLNAIAPLITNFFMISYAFINYACFATATAKVPGWRPSFTYFNRWVALAGTFMCIVLMFVINYIFSLATLTAAMLLYKYVDWQENDVNWGSARQAKIYLDALKQTARLEVTREHVKTYRPAFLVLCDDPGSERSMTLVRFADLFARVSNGVLEVSAVVVGSFDTAFEEYLEMRTSTLLVDAGITGFIDSVIAPDLQSGHRLLLQTAGVGKLRPNTIVLELPTTRSGADSELVRTVREALVLDYSTVLVRAPVPNFPDALPVSGRIDVWWMAADGGLPLLMAWLLRQNKEWRKCSLRIIAGGLQCGNETSKSLNVLLPKLQRMLTRFRIPYTSTEVVDLTLEPSERSLREWSEVAPASETRISSKTRQLLRQRDLLREMSSDAGLVIVTMPLPASIVPDDVWLAWNEMHVVGDVPTVLVRGAHQDVLTYYS